MDDSRILASRRRPPSTAGVGRPARGDNRGVPWILVADAAAGDPGRRRRSPARPVRAFAARARNAGVHATLSVYDDMVHVWHLKRDVTPPGQRAVDEARTFARARTSAAS